MGLPAMSCDFGAFFHCIVQAVWADGIAIEWQFGTAVALLIVIRRACDMVGRPGVAPGWV
jgi:hypothetical protein